MHPRAHKLLSTTATLLALAGLALTPAAAGPEGATVVGGSATIQGAGTSSVTINQTSSRAIINWNTFNIGVGETTTFNQPNSSSVVLNRVTGGLGPSEILGTLNANGIVFVINRDGILFGKGAVVNTAGFVATTHDIKNQDFMAGRYNFNIPGRPDASIVNLGTITAASGGFAALVAPGVRNSGTITATLGTVALGAANGFTLDLYGDRLITLAVNDQIAASVKDVATGKSLKSLITNDGKIRANGGRVELTAAAARTVVDSVINTSGVIKANSIGTRNGMIVLSAGTATTKPAGAPTQVVRVSGTLSAVGKKKDTKGGTILVTGEDIQFVGAVVDASGRAGGGKVLIGGDWAGGRPDTSLVSNQSARLESFAIPAATTVSVDAGTTINASAKDRGDGGKVILWSDQMTTFAGTILARGGAQSGNGGFVETSGKQQLAFTGTVDTRAPNGAAGTLLLDPYNVTISTSPTISPSTFPPGGTWEPTDNGSNINVIDLQNQLELGNVIVTTTSAVGTEPGNITVSAAVTWTSANTLTLRADHEIFINAPITALAGGLTLSAGGNITTAAISGSVDVAQFTLQSGTWNQNISSPYLPTFVAQDFRITGGTFIRAQGGDGLAPSTAYQITDVYGLQGIGSAGMTGKHFKLVNSIDAGVTATWNGGRGFVPIGTTSTGFSGTFDGQFNTIASLTIAPNDATTQSIGLFGTIASTVEVSDFKMTGASVSANPGFDSSVFSQWVGIVAGSNAGTITRVSASGTVNGLAIVGVQAGGLVGQNGTLGPGGHAGLITLSSADVAVTVGNGSACNPGPCHFNAAGGLVGSNVGGSTISNSLATGMVTAGNSAWAGGLVGQNGFSTGAIGIIQNSYASGNVSAVAPNGAAGGLVGYNSNGSTITDSQAFGAVSVTGTSINGFSNAGGLVGANQGAIVGTTDPTGQTSCAQGAGWSCASGNVSVGSLGSGGGLVGFNQGLGNDGLIINTFATGAVTGASGTEMFGDRQTNIGGLVGTNLGMISFSHATGNVGSPTVDMISAGGLVADNVGAINNSYATGNVSVGNKSFAGGLVNNNSIGNNECFGACNTSSLIVDSFATGNVTAGSSSIAGGLAAGGNGTFLRVAASGIVSAADNSIVGGLVGALLIGGSIQTAAATGSATSTGPNSVVGGLVGVNGGTIALGAAAAPVSVTGSSESILGGFVGVNLGFITQSLTTPNASVTGPGNHDIVGGFFGVNFGTITDSSSAGTATGGPNSIVGGFGGINASFVNFAPGVIPGSSFPGGTVTNSTASGTASGGPGSTTDAFIAVTNPTSGVPAYPSFIATCGDQLCEILRTGRFAGDTTGPDSPQPQPQIIQNLVANPQLAALNTNPVVTITPPPPGSPRQGPAPTNPYLPPGFSERIFDIPPLTETRFIKDEVLLQIATTVTIERLQEAVRQFGLSMIEFQSLGTTGSIALRFRITNGQTVQDIIRQLASVQIIAVAQPIYVYALAQQPPADPAPASRGDTGQQGVDQYVLEKLKLADVHRVVKGTNVTIAVIDSEIDAAHPDLLGVIAQRFSAVGAPEKPHAHGTGMAGAIGSRQKVVGIAPGARLMAVHAFSTNAANVESTTYQILKGLDWAVSQGVRIINMSFAGPKDPSLERSIKSAYDKGIVLIAAAGNAGPRSPPLYPGADPNVIAVTATDVDDKLFAGANRGKYISVAAPGVDILVPAPDGAYQLTTGTSVAAAEVSGVVALLLERNPNLKPADIRRILTTSAKRLGPGERDDEFGSGLVDPLKAILLADPRTVSRTPAPPPPLRQR